MPQSEGLNLKNQEAEVRKYSTVGRECHTKYGMKMTMHIDEALLQRVIESYGYSSKTEAVEMALRELDRRTRFKTFLKVDSEIPTEEWKNAVYPGYDPKDLSNYHPLNS